MNVQRPSHKFLFTLFALLALFPFVPSGAALLVGMIFALTLGNPFLDSTRKNTSKLLQVSIVGLGAGMNLGVVIGAGLQGILYTAIGIIVTMFLGNILGKLIRTPKETSLLVTVGTAICGGSAIAAVASTIRAKNENIAVALATVFFLNAVALFIFPLIGHLFFLDQIQFGLWSAIAVHDTSSVVGASMQYGAKALEVATVVKLARALWIIPVALMIGAFWNRKKEDTSKPKIQIPWFIFGFLLTAALVTWIPILEIPGAKLAFLAKRTLVLTLFLIGSGLTKETLKKVGVRPFVQGFVLWVIVATLSLIAVSQSWIS